MCGSQRNLLISSYCSGWSALRQYPGPSPIPDDHQWSLWLWKILFIYLLMTSPSAVTSLILQTGRPKPLPSLQILKKITSWSNTWNMSFNPHKSHTRPIALRKDCLANPHIYFLNNLLEELQSFKLLGLTISHYLSWANHNSNWSCKTSRQLHPPSNKVHAWHTWTPIHLQGRPSSTAWWSTALPSAGYPTSHLVQLIAVETKAFNIIEISRDEAESMGLPLHHNRQVVGLSVFHLLFHIPSRPLQISAGHTWSTINPILVKQPKSRSTVPSTHSLLFFFPSVEPTSTLSSISFFLWGIQDRCSPLSQIVHNSKP